MKRRISDAFFGLKSGLLSLCCLFLSAGFSNVHAASQIKYYEVVSANYELLSNEPGAERHVDKLIECWAIFHEPKKWEKAHRDEFLKRELLEQSKLALEKQYKKLKPLDKDYVFFTEHVTWKLGEYNFDTESIPVHAWGFRHRTHGGTFHPGTPKARNGAYCMPSSRMRIINDYDEVASLLALQRSPKDARRLLKKLKDRKVYPKFYYKLAKAYVGYKEVLIELSRIELYGDKFFSKPIHTVDLNHTVDLKTSAAKSSPSNKTRKSDISLNKAEIKNLQIALAQSGYSAGVADGIWGKKTTAALKQWQSSKGLKVTGRVGQSEKKLLLR